MQQSEQKQHEDIALTSVLKPSWYVEQMKGWTKRSYILLIIGLVIIGGTTFLSPITFDSIMTMLAGMLGFTCTISITNTKPLNGIFGLVSALIYIYVAFTAKNYSDMLLQTVYILLLDLPVLLMPGWAKNVNERVRTVKESKHSSRNWALFALFFVVVLAALYFFESRYTNSPRPAIDSLAAAIGITGALLTTLRFSDTYYFWLAQGLMSVTLWGITAMQGGANWVLFITYILYLSNDFIAFFDKGVAWFHHNQYHKEA
ncbi:nicotinamide mononucleotide transporter [Lactobacillus selangorensis]|uniref:Nicotinamide mononucleotide transporter n=1 Tax=Lactobacillus selangorensis TaxID=81857 RepID=A0A0R2FVL1_9LACO|nr:nicotinamide riboside transporter PnuC [Lactobacillus selangorensis]KRN29290.1 nicotinamide mononucleotide transporter [Lactobacillus selangorensis]KRN34181.1 nicotinamide mononucleotide transporter [Lactobacillus selangorensis]